MAPSVQGLKLRRVRNMAVHAQQVGLVAVPGAGPTAVHASPPITVFVAVALATEAIRTPWKSISSPFTRSSLLVLCRVTVEAPAILFIVMKNDLLMCDLQGATGSIHGDRRVVALRAWEGTIPRTVEEEPPASHREPCSPGRACQAGVPRQAPGKGTEQATKQTCEGVSGQPPKKEVEQLEQLPAGDLSLQLTPLARPSNYGAVRNRIPLRSRRTGHSAVAHHAFGAVVGMRQRLPDPVALPAIHASSMAGWPCRGRLVTRRSLVAREALDVLNRQVAANTVVALGAAERSRMRDRSGAPDAQNSRGIRPVASGAILTVHPGDQPMAALPEEVVVVVRGFRLVTGLARRVFVTERAVVHRRGVMRPHRRAMHLLPLEQVGVRSDILTQPLMASGTGCRNLFLLMTGLAIGHPNREAVVDVFVFVDALVARLAFDGLGCVLQVGEDHLVLESGDMLPLVFIADEEAGHLSFRRFLLINRLMAQHASLERRHAWGICAVPRRMAIGAFEPFLGVHLVVEAKWLPTLREGGDQGAACHGAAKERDRNPPSETATEVVCQKFHVTPKRRR